MAQKLNTAAIITVSSAGTAVQISSVDTPVTSIVLQADVDNTGNVFIGDSTVSASNGIELTPGQSFELKSDQIPRQDGELILSDIYVDAATNDDKVRVSYIKRR